MIYTHIAWTPGTKCQGDNYNTVLDLHKDEDWIAFIDSDAMIINTGTWYEQLEWAIKEYPKAKGFTCRTNRVNSFPQLVRNIDVYNHDILYHKRVGDYLSQKYYKHVTPHFNKKYAGHFSGMWFCVHVGTIRKLGGFYKSGGLSLTDNIIHKALIENKHEFYILDGMYVYHYYRPGNEWDYYKNGTKKFQEHAMNINFELTDPEEYPTKNVV
jgi:hypothetical protein